MGHASTRNPALDGIRAFAVLAVVGMHLGLPLAAEGGFGVNTFFTLSGFLITFLLLAEQRESGGIRLKAFYGRRVLRLFPALALTLILGSCYTLLFGDAAQSRSDLISVLAVVFYASNWVRAFSSHNLGTFGVTWSLSVEEQFYLVWPVVLIFVGRRWRARGVLYAALAGSAISLILRVILWRGDASWIRTYNGTDTEADQLLLGCALAAAMVVLRGRSLARASRALSLLAWPAAVAIVAAIALWPRRPDNLIAQLHFVYTVGITILALLTCAIIGNLVTQPEGRLSRILGWRPFAWIGSISYGIYLYHMPVRAAVATIFGHFFGGGTMKGSGEIVIALSIMVAAASYYLVERPIQRRWRHLFVVRTDRTAAPETRTCTFEPGAEPNLSLEQLVGTHPGPGSPGEQTAPASVSGPADGMAVP